MLKLWIKKRADTSWIVIASSAKEAARILSSHGYNYPPTYLTSIPNTIGIDKPEFIDLGKLRRKTPSRKANSSKG